MSDVIAAPTGPTATDNAAAAGGSGPAGYELLDEIGRGGMGVVYRARDLHLGREVALKRLQDNAPTDDAAAARFRAEAYITGQLQHPGIPAVHELGTLPDGRPFLAMKLVQGRTLQELLKARTDPGQDRGRFIAIFEHICQAVGYAHAHGVIHRDLKPQNVMVGAFGEVQVMDWGLAKRLADRVRTEGEGQEQDEVAATAAYTPFDTPQASGTATKTGSVLGTPAYMPPEQAGGEIHKLDPRSDVFGLGAVLCQILTGRPPYGDCSGNELRIQAVRGESADALAALDASGAEPELVALCKQCLAFQQDDRPADGAAVATEVARIRQAAEERARSAELDRAEALVRAAEQSKRRRVLQWAAGAVAAVLLLGVVGTTLGLVRANAAAEQERIANQAAQVEKANAQLAAANETKARLEEERERKYAQAIADFVRDDVLALSSLEGLDRFARVGSDRLDRNMTVRQLMDRAAEKLRARQDLDPRIQAELCWMIGVNYRAVGEFDAAVRFLERSSELRRSLFGAVHVDTWKVENSLALAYHEAGKLDKALPLYDATLKAWEAKLGADHPDTLLSRNNLALAYRDAGQLDKALPLFEATLKAQEANLGVDHPHSLTSRNNLALAYRSAGQLDKALTLYDATLQAQMAKLGPDHPHTLISRNNLATAYQAAGQLDKALPLFEATVQAQEAKLGTDHPDTLTVRNNLASAYEAAGHLNKALPLLEATLKAAEAKLGADHPVTLNSRNNLAAAYKAAGQLDRALPLFEATLKAQEANLGVDHPHSLTSRNNLALAYRSAGQLDKALPLLEATLKAVEAKLGADHPHSLTSRNNLALAYQDAGQLDRALPLYEQAAVGFEKRRFQHEHAGRILGNTAASYEKAGQLDRAESWRRKWLAHLRDKTGATSPAYADELAALGRNLLLQKRWTEAEAILRECLALREKLQPEAWTTFDSLSRLGGALLGQKKFADAEPLLLKGYAGMKARAAKIPPQSSTRLPEALDRLIELYSVTNQPDEAKKWQAEKDKRAEQSKKKEPAPKPDQDKPK